MAQFFRCVVPLSGFWWHTGRILPSPLHCLCANVLVPVGFFHVLFHVAFSWTRVAAGPKTHLLGRMLIVLIVEVAVAILLGREAQNGIAAFGHRTFVRAIVCFQVLSVCLFVSATALTRIFSVLTSNHKLEESP